VDAALGWIRRFTCTREVLEGQDSAAALSRLRVALEAHLGEAGVRLDSRAWIVTVRLR